MKKSILIMSVTLMIGIIFAVNTFVLAEDLGLIQSLSNNLGVTEKQATGGAGSIFNVAKQKLSADDFAQVAKAVPGIDNMMAAAPKSDGATGILGGASSLFGGSAPSVDKVANLSGSFSQLGMNAGMVNKFIPVILDYVKSKGGDQTMKILQSGLL
jgi:Protein of unknown function VcgC/VcgE (DUF2780)